jgi:hypothetical protein
MDFPQDTSRQFLAASAALTGFSEIELVRTGMAIEYWNTLVRIVGITIAGEFLSAFASAFEQAQDDPQLPDTLDQQILQDPKFGPLARNVISLWYLGQWNALPRTWADAYGGSPADTTQVVSSQAYIQGLVWGAFGGHPQGAKPTGFGSWAEPPPDAAAIIRMGTAPKA